MYIFMWSIVHDRVIILGLVKLNQTGLDCISLLIKNASIILGVAFILPLIDDLWIIDVRTKCCQTASQQVVTN